MTLSYSFEDNYWVQANFTIRNAKARFRVDKWNGEWWIVGGEALGSRATSDIIVTINVTNGSSIEQDFTLPYQAESVGQCPYNDETFIAFGGTNDENSETYDMFHIIGANLVEYCDSEKNEQNETVGCLVNCSDLFICTDRNIMVNPYDINEIELFIGTLSGYGLTIQLGYNSSSTVVTSSDDDYLSNTTNSNSTSTDTPTTTTTTITTTTTVLELPDLIDININVLADDGNGFSACDMMLNYFDKSVTVPVNMNLNCQTKESCLDGIFQVYGGSNISMICYGNDTCSGTKFTSTGFDYTKIINTTTSIELGDWTLIDNVDLVCIGENSCQTIIFDIESTIVRNLKLVCLGNNSCAGMQLRSLDFDISCIGENSCESALFYGADAELLSTTNNENYENQTGKLVCNGTRSCQTATVLNIQSHSYVEIICSGNYSCNDILIQTLMIDEYEDTNENIIIDIERYSWIIEQIVKIDCIGMESCYDMTVFCPMIVPDKGNSQCIINLNNYIINGDIYAISGAEYVNINCSNNEFDPTWLYFNQTIGNDTIKIGEDFGVCDNVTLHCGSFFDYKCHMEFILDDEYETTDLDINGSYSWVCDGNCSTFAATLAPTDAPSIAPSNSPSTIPSTAPSNSPTTAPSMAPSNVPTDSPTNAPTLHPTRVPTNYVNYTMQISIEFKIFNITNEHTIVEFFILFEDSVYYDLKEILEKNYVSSGSSYLHYYDFDIVFYEISGNIAGTTLDSVIDDSLVVIEAKTTIAKRESNSLNTYTRRNLLQTSNNSTTSMVISTTSEVESNQGSESESQSESIYDNSTITLHSYIYCIDGTEDLLQSISEDSSFVASVSNNFGNYFNESSMKFDVDMTSWIETDLNTISNSNSNNQTIDEIYFILGIICIVLFIISFCAYLHTNKKLLCCGCPRADGVAFWRVWIYGLQMWDLFSDMNFANEVISLAMTQGGGDLLIFAIAILSPLFVIIPYCANIFAAINMYKRIGLNNVARLYFEQKLIFFCSLVLLSGGVHASISLVCSRIFGISLFDCGLSKRELSQFTDLRLLYSVLLENFPQLIMQIVYIIYGGGWDTAVVLAMITSIFSGGVAAFAHFFRSQMGLFL